MQDQRINADFTERVVIATAELPWIASPTAGVERRLLDRIGGEVARATSLVRYARESAFPAHAHGMGEEFFVLDGVFSDEHGDYPKGTYVRNPPGSRHSPRTSPGCTIFVKLRQMTPSERTRLVIDSNAATWVASDSPDLCRLPLYRASDSAERVALERLAGGSYLSEGDCPGGEEIFLLSGSLRDEYGSYEAGTWIRNPAGFRRSLQSPDGAEYWVKRGHLRPTS
jgi:anti-sigma factor ChrR (cupin superfamily)